MATAAAVAAPTKPAAPPPPSTPPKFVASQLLDINSIEPDPKNLRQDFPKEEMNQLINSVMLFGVREPIEVRALGGGKHRIVFGERRYRAAKAAGLKEIPAIPRTMTELEATEVQLAENLERADLSALEIAGGYKRQLELGRTIDQVCERSGRKRTQVYAMLQLLQLGDAGRKALGEGAITASVAQLVARVPKALQEKALGIVAGTTYTKPLTHSQAEVELGKVFLVDLNKAPWKLKDETLPCVAKSCQVCPKRSGNAADLFPDVKNHDACTDPEAYRQKLHAHAKAEVAKAGFKKLLSPAEAPPEKLFWNGGRGPLNPDSGFVDPDEKVHEDTQSRTVKQLLTPEQREKLIVVALDADGKQRHLVERAGLMRELKKGGLFKERKKGQATQSSSPKSSAPKEYKPPEPSLEEKVDAALVAACVAAVEKKGLTPALLKHLVISSLWNTEYLAERRGLPNRADLGYGLDEKKFDKLFGKLSAGQMAGLLYEAVLLDRAYVDGGEELRDACKTLDVDAEKIAAELERANLVAWTTAGKTTSGKGKSGTKYTIKEEKAEGPTAKKWGVKVWFTYEQTSPSGSMTGIGSSSSSPHKTAEELKAGAIANELRLAKKGGAR